MRPFTPFFLIATALFPAVSAHYRFNALIVDGVTTPTYEYVRENTNYNSPVADITSLDFRCNVGGLESAASTSTYTVAAGSNIGFAIDVAIYHSGVINVYMAKAPGKAQDFDGSGEVWFKVSELSAITDGGTSIRWPSTGLTQYTFDLPKALPDGEYLVRIEQIALHNAARVGGVESFMSCAQIQVVGGGTGKPSPLVAIPGVYTGKEPGILIDIYWPVPATYIQPGPAVWTG